MTVSASIVTYKTDRNELKKCIESMQINFISPIFISDNSPTDELKSFCTELKEVVYIYNNSNIGYGAGHNIAIRKTIELKTDYHLVINSDVYFDKGIIGQIIAYMDQNEDVAQLIPNTVYPNGDLQYVVRLLPTPANLIFRRFLPKSVVKRMNNRYLLQFYDHKNPINVPYHQGSFMFFRTKCLEKVGLFDERFFMYPEDIDITRRMHKHYKTMFWPQVTIVHAHRAASYKSKKMLKIHMENMIKYFNKWGWFFDKERRTWNRQLLKELYFKHSNS